MGKFDVVADAIVAANAQLDRLEARREYPKTKDFYELRRIRKGKTAKDRANGAHANRLKNRDARNEWCNNRNAKNGSHPSGNK